MPKYDGFDAKRLSSDAGMQFGPGDRLVSHTVYVVSDVEVITDFLVKQLNIGC